MLSNNLLVDVIRLFPDDIDCFIQAPALENDIFDKLASTCDIEYYKLLKLDKHNKTEFIDELLFNSIADYFQNIQIKQGTKLLFEAYDGVEFGILSKNIRIPEEFKNAYVPNVCVISDNF